MLKPNVAVSLAVAFLAFLSVSVRAQQTYLWGIEGSADVQTALPTTTLGGGGPCNSSVSFGSGNDLLEQTSYNLISPLTCSGSITAADPTSGALYSASALGQVSSFRVRNGDLSLALSTEGGTADPNEINNVGGYAFASFIWRDVLALDGGTSPTVLLKVSYLLQGSITASGAITGSKDEALYSYLGLGPSGNNVGVDCGTPALTTISQAYIYPPVVNQIINISPSYLLCVPAGSTLLLSKMMLGTIDGYGQWSGAVDANEETYITVLTPGVTLESFSGLTYTAPSSIPASGNTCDGVYGGTFDGDIVVSSGQNCTFVSGEITGNVQQNGGKLMLTGTTIGGNLQINGGTFSIGSSVVIDGEAQVQNLPVGTMQNQFCGATVKGDLLFHNNGTAVQIGSGSQSCPGNVIGGDLQVQNSTASTQLYNNTIGGNLHVQNNLGATQVFGNSVTDNLQCQNDASITGGANTAEQKQGQCVTF